MPHVPTRTVFLCIALMLVPGARGEPGTPARNPRCVAYCQRVEAECSQHARRATQECSRLAATGGVDAFTQRRDHGAYFSGFFRGPDHCMQGYGHAGCVERFRARYSLCTDAYLSNTASEYLKCSDGERTALGQCRDELAACQSSC